MKKQGIQLLLIDNTWKPSPHYFQIRRADLATLRFPSVLFYRRKNMKAKKPQLDAHAEITGFSDFEQNSEPYR